jgi:hypothetical protein
MKKLLLIACFAPLFSFAQTSTERTAHNGCMCSCGSNYNSMVDRNRQLNITSYTNGDLKQDGLIIGTYAVTQEWVGNDRMMYENFYLPNGTLAAEATYVKYGTTYELYTVGDGRTRTLNIVSTAYPADNIAEYLSMHFYM